MRFFISLIVLISAAALSFFASAEDSRGVSAKPEAQREETVSNSRCAKKIVLPGSNETACLMQKRKGHA